MTTPLLLTGIGLRPSHYESLLQNPPGVAWLEVHSENYFAEGGKASTTLERFRKDYPISLHGVGLSIGSTDELNWSHLKKLRDLCHRIQPCLVSEHLSWSSINGRHLPDLLPLPYTEEALNHVCERIQQVQDYLGRQILIENISAYLSYTHSSMPEWEFLRTVAATTQCGILLDINNIYVSAYNLKFDAEEYITQLVPACVQEIHLAGFSTSSHKDMLIDSHNNRVAPDVWELYRFAINHVGRKPTIIEWDNDVPALDTLYKEARHAEGIQKEVYETAKSAI
jgi:uncharacterized protein (UPF0276 family)